MADTPLDGAQDAPQPETPTTPPAEPADDSQQTFSLEYVQELRQEAAQRRTALKEMQEQFNALKSQLEQSQTEAEKAEQAKLAEQGKYKELFDEASQKLAKMEDAGKQAKRLQEALTGVLETQLAGVPDHIKTLLNKLDPVEQLEWLANYRQTLTSEPEPPKPQGKQTVQQQLAGFNPSGENGVSETDKQRIERLQQKAGVGVSVFGSQR